jgi:hypothetical protein
VLSGVLDGGVDVPHSEEKIVKERMKGEHIVKYAKSLGSGSEEYTAKFSKYTAQNVAPEKISEHFNKVKAEIIGSFKATKGTTEEKKAPQEKEAPIEEEKAPAKKAAAKPKTATKPKTAAKAPVVPKEKASKKGEKKA